MRSAGRAVLLSFLVMLAVGDRVGVAAGDEERAVRGFLADYVAAFEEGNPFLLAKYDPDGKVFGALMATTWFDRVALSRVELRDSAMVRTGSEGMEVTFVKVQEDQFQDGLMTRGVVGVKVEVAFGEGGLKVLSHRVVPPPGASEGYESGDPETWGAEHSQVERLLFSGLESLREGDLASAQESVSAAVELAEGGDLPKFLMGPSTFLAMCHYYKGMLAFRNGDSEGALAALERALTLHPDFPVALNLRAELALAEGEYERAVELWGRSLAVYPRQAEVAEVRWALGRALEGEKRKRRDLVLSLINLPPSQAVSVLSPVVKANPRDGLLVVLLARAYGAVGDPEKALEVLEQSKLVGREVEATYTAARLYLRLKNQQEALRLFEEVWKKEAGYRDSLAVLVSLHAGLGHFAEAISYLSLGAGEGMSAVAHALLGKYSLLAGRFLDAVGHLERACEGRLPSAVRVETAALMARITRAGR